MQDSNTEWVRLFVVWSFWWPNPPARPADPIRTPYSPPVPSPENQNQVIAQVRDLNRNINVAKGAGKKVMIVTTAFPRWVNGTNPASTSETGYVGDNNVLPPDNALILPTRKPPNGIAFQPSDFMYFWWIRGLMLLYHPGNANRSPFAEGASIDALELVNEPNILRPQPNGKGPATPLARSAALMMHTAKWLKTSFNLKYRKNNRPLYLLGPATAQVGAPFEFERDKRGKRKSWETFTDELLGNLRSLYHSKRIVDREFGWSQHNYADMEAIARHLHRAKQALDALGPAVPDSAKSNLFNAAAPRLYGHGTQTVRGKLTGRWYGWRDKGDPDPTVVLTEGGATLEKMPGFGLPPKVDDPNAHYDKDGNLTSNPAAAQKELQAYSVGGAIEALKNRDRTGKGVEMLTNYLFFDDIGRNFSGLCDQYGPYRASPPYVPAGDTTPQHSDPGPNVSAANYQRPAYTKWKNFKL